MAVAAGNAAIGGTPCRRLLEGTLIASIISLLLLGARFQWLSMQGKRTLSV